MATEKDDQNLFTVGQAAQRIAKVLGKKPDFIARQLRTFLQRNLVAYAFRAGDGPTAPAMLGLPAVCQAAVQCALAERGFTLPADDRASVFHAAFLGMQTYTTPSNWTPAQERRFKAEHSLTPIESAIVAIRDGRSANLAIVFYRDARSKRVYIRASVFLDGKFSSTAPDLHTPVSYIPEGVHIIHLQPVLLPLVAVRDGMN